MRPNQHLKFILRSKWLRLLSLCLLLGVGKLDLQSQITDRDGQEPEAAVNDSTQQDSIIPEKVVRAQTDIFDLQALAAAMKYRKEVDFDFTKTPYFDPLERLGGFTSSLGQIGKPYKRYHYGVDASFLQEGNFINPYTGAEDIYLMDPATEVRYFDTRTPYINVYFGQGPGQLGGLNVDVAKNVTPWWNIAVLYRRESSNGIYSQFETDHYNIYVNTNVRSRNGRYHLFANGMFQELVDDLNGGVAQIDFFENLFGKGSQPVALSGAATNKTARSLFLKQHYQVFKQDSSEKPQQLTVYHSVMRDFFQNQYTDTIINSNINDNLFLIYPTQDSLYDFFYERYRHNRWTFREGAVFRMDLPAFETGHQFYLTNQSINFEKKHIETKLNKTSQTYIGDLTLRPKPFALSGKLTLERASSNLFASENMLQMDASFEFPKAKDDYAFKVYGKEKQGVEKPDSVLQTHSRRPFAVMASALNYDRNPSLQQTYGNPWEGNNFAPDPNLGNMRVELFKLGFEIRGKDKRSAYGHQEGNRLSLTGFRSRQHKLIYFDRAMALQQAPKGSFLQFAGLEGRFRLRLGNFILENQSTWQLASASGHADLDSFFTKIQPNFYGKASIFWEKHDLKIARAIRIGMDYTYHLNFSAPLFDSPSQQFFPQAEFDQAGYHRIDLLFTAHIKRAQLSLRMYNLFEGLGTSGYFTTMLYPMLGRSFLLGINWSFYD